MAMTTAPTPEFPTVADGGYDPAVVDAAFEAERAWRHYLEERAALLLREAQALHAALALPTALSSVAAPREPIAALAAVAPVEFVAPVEPAEDLKTRQTAEKRRAAAEKRKATIAAKKAAAQAELEQSAKLPPAAPKAVPAQGDPDKVLSPGAAWARRTSGATAPAPAVKTAKPRAVAAVPAPSALNFPAIVPTPTEEPKARRATAKHAPKPAVPSPATIVFGPVATMGPILEPAGAGGRIESRVIRLV